MNPQRSTATKSSVSAALRRAGYNTRRTGIRNSNPLRLHGGDHGTPVRLYSYSRLAGDTLRHDTQTIIRFDLKARALALECRDALIAAGYTCTDITTHQGECSGFAVTRYPQD